MAREIQESFSVAWLELWCCAEVLQLEEIIDCDNRIVLDDKDPPSRESGGSVIRLRKAMLTQHERAALTPANPGHQRVD
jgi:hypothetical protein